MGTIPFWGDAPGLWDTVKIGPYTLPGTAQVKGDITRRVQTDTAPNSDTTHSTDLGYGGAQVTVSVQLWTQDHLDAFQQIAQAIRPQKTDGDGAIPYYDVVHPALALVGISSLLVYRVSVPEKGQTSGTYEAQIEMQEFIPETKGTSKLTGGAVQTGVSTELDQNLIDKQFSDTAQNPKTPPSKSPPGPTK